jgi:plasmid stabilization system protein ParE
VSWQVWVRPEAELDLYRAAVWYEAQRTGLGREFLESVRTRFRELSSSALQYAEVDPGIRRALIRRFPYSVYFKIEGPDLVVLAVLHQSRRVDPGVLVTERR